MTVKTKKKEIPDNSTQRYLPFSQIKENVMIMKDGSARVIMKCSPINFLLKSTEEQDSIIISFQRFLNSLSFPIQIIVRSTKLDIDSYIANLKDKALNQKNPLLQNQTYEYIEYLKKLIEVAQIMKKDFYVVIPFDETEGESVKDTSFFGSFKQFLASMKAEDDVFKIREQIRKFSKTKKSLINRSNQIKTSLEGIGIKANTLEKSDLIKYITDYYNPNMEDFSQIKQDTQSFNLINN
ncbi:MAG: hypothetical protein Q9M94_01335 [Candidatus Gracilibacteria bacterium]|nr:hypothetical protein [Candidatus Gracilibacteria bacterium]MDQ7023254.1 hypothetical protein [Candidatus Gracilibacteria bacterium]